MIEVYEVEARTPQENEAEHIELLASLGLTGQMDLVAKSEGGVAVNPYRAMDDADKRVVKALCPQECKISDFKREVIPFRVLELAANALANKWFTELRVCYTENNADPFLVGVVEERMQYSSTNPDAGTYMAERARFLIARWGDELMSWPDLVKRAKEIWKAEKTAELHNKIVESQACLDSIDAKADLYFMGRYVNI